MCASLFSEALPQMDLWDLLLGRKVDLVVEQDNQATIIIAREGYSAKLRHVLRTHKVNIGSIKEVLDDQPVTIHYIKSDEQAADIFTKPLGAMQHHYLRGKLTGYR